ncbi:bestrophin-like domain [Streptomyces sp. NPDC004244]|uniref:bestrophin-like domain n=1 Tax=Streptomyces sp. NPDC101206 TaxID=3366128 RepID=UPI0038149A98
MILWLLNSCSTLTLGLLMVGGFTGLAVAGSLAARRRFPHLAGGEHNEMVGVALGMFGAIYGIILAFVVVTLWTQLENAQGIVSSEATDLALIVRSAEAFPPEERTRVEQAVGAYVHSVVEVQWPLMREGRPSYDATAQQTRGLYQALQAYEPTGTRTTTFYEQAADRLNDVAAQRRARIDMAGTSLPMLLQLLVYGGALVILPLTFLFGLRSLKMQLLFVSAVAGLIGFSLLLVMVLDRPFAGELSVSPAPYKEAALSQFWPGRSALP